MAKGNKKAQAAWFKYKEAVKNTTRPAQSCVDFVAGFNAAMELSKPKEPKPRPKEPKFKRGDLVWSIPCGIPDYKVWGIVVKVSAASETAYILGPSFGNSVKFSELRPATELAIVRWYRKKGIPSKTAMNTIVALYERCQIKVSCCCNNCCWTGRRKWTKWAACPACGGTVILKSSKYQPSDKL